MRRVERGKEIISAESKLRLMKTTRNTIAMRKPRASETLLLIIFPTLGYCSCFMAHMVFTTIILRSQQLSQCKDGTLYRTLEVVANIKNSISCRQNNSLIDLVQILFLCTDNEQAGKKQLSRIPKKNNLTTASLLIWS